MAWQDRIEIDPARLGGKPVVRGSRLAVELDGLPHDGRVAAEALAPEPVPEHDHLVPARLVFPRPEIAADHRPRPIAPGTRRG